MMCPPDFPPRVSRVWHGGTTDDEACDALCVACLWLRKSRLLGGGGLKVEKEGAEIADLAGQRGVSEATIYNWKAKYGSLEVTEVRRLRELESENAKLKRLLAATMLDNVALTRRAV